ncbi:monosaccharide ABC transporter substrate-binding protein, CUT2 family [Marinitoga hydrogenitolerans DSM 16785]|uniref:Monosaccharide ABC transporter substrate-binding protein, CUT2 family n=2 Tax=Marinitoga TaxID=160798 RepID=A0A1M4VII3_MARH1|nr:D-ribose ABC transporter substrate-binding protein [Marinitoga hydrogenitolerans]SHE68665.1 monosaccharide ABC transporter substrate-binding protein, CUT2 family [Marinitoga hydrogenitolerans DSM 16785]
MKRAVWLVVFIMILSLSVFSIKIGLSLSTLNNPFFVELRNGALQEAVNQGVDIVVVDAQDKPYKQLNDIEDLVQQRVDLIIINPTDSDAIVAAVEEANNAGIPVITVDRAANGGKVILHIASDNVAGGAMAAKYIADLLNGKGNVVELVGIPGTSAARDRGLGFETELKKYPGLKLIAKQTANFNRAEGLSVMENLLQAYPEIDAVFAQNDEMALGAIEAIKSEGKLGKIVVVGFDAIPDAVNAVKNGEMAATVAQQPSLMGELAVKKAVEYLETQTIYIPVNLKLVVK